MNLIQIFPVDSRVFVILSVYEYKLADISKSSLSSSIKIFDGMAMSKGYPIIKNCYSNPPKIIGLLFVIIKLKDVAV